MNRVYNADTLSNAEINPTLHLSNSLDGTMPRMVFSMPNLKTLNLKENNVFMSFDSIARATSLEVLYISNMDLGSIEGIGKAPVLNEL